MEIKTTNISFKRLFISFIRYSAGLQLVDIFQWYKMAELLHEVNLLCLKYMYPCTTNGGSGLHWLNEMFIVSISMSFLNLFYFQFLF